MLSIPGVVCNQVRYEQPPFYNSYFSISNRSVSLFGKVFLEEISSKMISVWSHGHLRKKHPFESYFDSSLPPESNDELSNQPARFSRLYLTIVLAIASPIPKYTKEDLQWIFRTILEARVSTTSKKSKNKSLKICSSDVYCSKFYMECYNFCQ